MGKGVKDEGGVDRFSLPRSRLKPGSRTSSSSSLLSTRWQNSQKERELVAPRKRQLEAGEVEPSLRPLSPPPSCDATSTKLLADWVEKGSKERKTGLPNKGGWGGRTKRMAADWVGQKDWGLEGQGKGGLRTRKHLLCMHFALASPEKGKRGEAPCPCCKCVASVNLQTLSVVVQKSQAP